MTDDARTPAGDGPSAPEPGRPAPEAQQPPSHPDPSAPRAMFAGFGNRRRWWFLGLIAVVVVLLVCGGATALAIGFGRLARASDDAREGRARVDSACFELEERLNRLAPPGAAASPAQRAAAIRNENVAVRAFLTEIEQLRSGRRDSDPDDDDRRERWHRVEDWRRLLDARTAYADALDRQVTTGEPAFFAAPRDRRGRPVLEELRRVPESCAGAVRRLGAPDL